MAKALVQKVKGTRDFYPEDMVWRKWLYAQIQDVSTRYGYQEFDGPEIERIELYAEKTSEEIVREQAFTLSDRDGRVLALRPELTPTFARLVAARSGELTLPIRWFSFGRAWRYEQPQTGRGREFFQWEINVLGPESPEADAEILALAADFFRSLNLTPNEVVIRVNDRSCLDKTLQDLGLTPEQILPVIRIIDRKDKLSGEVFETALQATDVSPSQITNLQSYLSDTDVSRSPWLERVFAALADYPGALDYISYDPVIVRGFDYYTRTVFEAWDRTGNLRRSLFGGGRFDNLTATLGGKRIPGVGMAPGDMPIEALLRRLGKLPELKAPVAQILITVSDSEALKESRRLAAELRASSIAAELWLGAPGRLDKQMSYADKKAIPYVAIIGPNERANSKVILRNLTTSRQTQLNRQDLASQVSELAS